MSGTVKHVDQREVQVQIIRKAIKAADVKMFEHHIKLAKSAACHEGALHDLFVDKGVGDKFFNDLMKLIDDEEIEPSKKRDFTNCFVKKDFHYEKKGFHQLIEKGHYRLASKLFHRFKPTITSRELFDAVTKYESCPTCSPDLAVDVFVSNHVEDFLAKDLIDLVGYYWQKEEYIRAKTVFSAFAQSSHAQLIDEHTSGLLNGLIAYMDGNLSNNPKIQDEANNCRKTIIRYMELFDGKDESKAEYFDGPVVPKRSVWQEISETMDPSYERSMMQMKPAEYVRLEEETEHVQAEVKEIQSKLITSQERTKEIQSRLVTSPEKTKAVDMDSDFGSDLGESDVDSDDGQFFEEHINNAKNLRLSPLKYRFELPDETSGPRQSAVQRMKYHIEALNVAEFWKEYQANFSTSTMPENDAWMQLNQNQMDTLLGSLINALQNLKVSENQKQSFIGVFFEHCTFRFSEKMFEAVTNEGLYDIPLAYFDRFAFHLTEACLARVIKEAIAKYQRFDDTREEDFIRDIPRLYQLHPSSQDGELSSESLESIMLMLYIEGYYGAFLDYCQYVAATQQGKDAGILETEALKRLMIMTSGLNKGKKVLPDSIENKCIRALLEIRHVQDSVMRQGVETKSESSVSKPSWFGFLSPWSAVAKNETSLARANSGYVKIPQGVK